MRPSLFLAARRAALALLLGAAGAVAAPTVGGAQSTAAAPAAHAKDGPAKDGPAEGGALVIVVRHAEKAAVPGDDPPLSEAGAARAAALARVLRDAPVRAVIVTPRRRTGETAAGVVAARGLTPVVVPFAANVADHARAVADAVRAAGGGTVLVVGHSNTVPAILAALGAPRLPDLCDAAYANLFVVRPGTTAAERATLVRASYGAADPADADARPGMQAR